METVQQRAAKLNARMTNDSIGHPRSANVSGKDLARVVQYFRSFPARRFSLVEIMGEILEPDLVSRYTIRGSKRQDDLTVLAKRLPTQGLIDHGVGSIDFVLTSRGIQLAEREIAAMGRV